MTNERIAEIKALCEASPWDNAEDFIAAARHIIPELLKALEDAKTKIEVREKLLSEFVILEE